MSKEQIEVAIRNISEQMKMPRLTHLERLWLRADRKDLRKRLEKLEGSA